MLRTGPVKPLHTSLVASYACFASHNTCLLQLLAGLPPLRGLSLACLDPPHLIPSDRERLEQSCAQQRVQLEAALAQTAAAAGRSPPILVMEFDPHPDNVDPIWGELDEACSLASIKTFHPDAIPDAWAP